MSALGRKRLMLSTLPADVGFAAPDPSGRGGWPVLGAIDNSVHVVWRITSYVGFALIALVLIWSPGASAQQRLYRAGAFAAVSYGLFFLTRFSMPFYGGRAHDDNA